MSEKQITMTPEAIQKYVSQMKQDKIDKDKEFLNDLAALLEKHDTSMQIDVDSQYFVNLYLGDTDAFQFDAERSPEGMFVHSKDLRKRAKNYE